MSHTRRFSIGGFSNSMPLGDASSHVNTRSFRSETPLKDRRAQLEEWRRSYQGEGAACEPNNKRARHHEGPPLRPPSIPAAPAAPPAPLFVTEGTTALERFRMRKMMNQQMQQPAIDEALNTSSLCYDDSEDGTAFSSSRLGVLGATPSGRRLGAPRTGSRRHSMAPVRPRASLLPTSQELDNSGTALSQHTFNTQHTTSTLSQLSENSEYLSAKSNPIDVVEGAGLRSQVLQQAKRIEELENELMVLKMSKAPLEARMRQQEDAWIKEQKSLLEEIDLLKEASCQADNKYRDLELKFEAADNEVRRLRLEVRKASSNLNMSTFDNAFSRQLQSDRDYQELKEELTAERLDKVSIEKELHATMIELESLAKSYSDLQQEYELISESTSNNRDAEIQLEVLSREHIATSAQLNAVCSELAATKARAEATLSAQEEEFKKTIEQLHFDMTVLKTRAGKVCDEMSAEAANEEDEAVLRARIEERDRKIAELEALVLKGEEIRRQMHNRIQELRGNIRVFVRTRPFLPSDCDSGESAIDVSPDGESLAIIDPRNDTPHDFQFDKVFPPSAGQDHVFQEISDFVQSALDGYQVCLFSYGQTGSGKTHTMQGSGNGAMRGIIPRAVEQILAQATVMQKQKWDFKLSASFLEIYNENLKDLLLLLSEDKSMVKNPPKLAIKRNREGKSFVDGLTEVPIDTVDTNIGMKQLEQLMGVAARARSVASTKMNEVSSRSHSVFILHIRGTNDDSGAEVRGSLNLCDLAGSERLSRSGADADAKRLKETQAINKSLSCLGDVFNALAQRAGHIPFRNSKLTYLLQDCLSGDGKALMFVNLSPTVASSGESLCSLRFAQRVNQVELGKPTKHIQYNR